MRARCRVIFLEKAETRLCDCGYAHSRTGRVGARGDGVAPAAVPTVCNRAQTDRVDRTRALGAKGLRRISQGAAVAGDSFAMEPEADLSKPGRMRLLRRLGKGPGGS